MYECGLGQTGCEGDIGQFDVADAGMTKEVGRDVCEIYERERVWRESGNDIDRRSLERKKNGRSRRRGGSRGMIP